MKIVLATPLYPPEIASPAVYVKEISLRLASRHEVTVVAYGNMIEKVPGVTLVGVSKKKRLLVRLLHYTVTLYKATNGADIIYTQNGIAASLPAMVVGYLRKIPVVLRFVEDEAWRRATRQHLTTENFENFLRVRKPNLHIRLMVALQGFIFRNATEVIVGSWVHREVLFHRYYVSGQCITTIYNPAPKREILPFNKRHLLYQIAVHTELTKTSGVSTIIEAIKQIKKEFPDVRLVIAGDGPEAFPLKAYAEKCGVARHTVFLGEISRAEEWHIRKTSQVFVQSSLESGVPDSVVWNFCAETPVIASDVPGFNEAIYHEGSGLLVKAGDATLFAHALRRIFNEDGLRAHLVTGGLAILKEQFSWEAHTELLFEALETVKKKL